MGEAINIPTDKIIFDKSIYPRFEVDPERIQFFVELLENEGELDPIRVVKHDGSYVLIEGKHRCDAHKICGIYEIPGIVEKIERKLWRLYAAKYNVRTAKPLSGDELKSVIAKVYEIDGIKKSSVIAENLSCTVQYVNKVLRSAKEEERQRKIARARELEAEGLYTRVEIAEKLSEEFDERIARPTLVGWLASEPGVENETVSISTQKVTNSTPEALSEQPFSQENQQQSIDPKSVTSTPQYDLENFAESDPSTLTSPTRAETDDSSTQLVLSIRL